MENYSSSETTDKTTSKESKSDGTAKPNVAKVQSIAELILPKGAAEQQHRTIWQRQATTETVASKDTIEQSEAIVINELNPAATAEQDTYLDELEPDEARAIAEQYATNRSAELQGEQAELSANSPEAAAAAADATMMRKLTEKLQAVPEVDTEQAIAEAADEVIAEAGFLRLTDTMPGAESETVYNPEPAIDESAIWQSPQTPPEINGNQPGFPGRIGGLNPNLAESASDEPSSLETPSITPVEAHYYARQAENRGLVVGGIVGYLVGRRRGRIKTEKRLLPIQRKLEAQVTKLHSTIVGREQQVRSLAAQKVRQIETKQVIASPDSRRVESIVLAPPRQPETNTVFAAVRSAEYQSTKSNVVPAEIIPAPEVLPIPLAPITSVEIQPVADSPAQRVERMSQQEVLGTAEAITIEGASLRQVYEAHRLTENGLRHIVTEYLRGGDVKRALDQELVIKEMTYERDPQLRDQRSAEEAPPPPISGAARSAAASSQSASANKPAPATPESPKKPSQTKSSVNNLLQGTLIRAWVVFVVLLIIVAIILLFRS